MLSSLPASPSGRRVFLAQSWCGVARLPRWNPVGTWGSRPSALLRGQAFACWGAGPVSVVLLAAEVERLALFPAFAAPRRLAGALAVLRHRLAGPVRRAGAQRFFFFLCIAVAILDAAPGAGGDDDGKQDWQAHAGDPFVRRDRQSTRLNSCH